MKITQTSLYTRVVIVIKNKKNKKSFDIDKKYHYYYKKKHIKLNCRFENKKRVNQFKSNKKKKNFKKFNKTSFTFNFYIELINIKNSKTKKNCFYCYQKHVAFNCRSQNEKRFDEQKNSITFNINIDIININFINVIINRLFFKTTKNV